jgi:hypothetical protein
MQTEDLNKQMCKVIGARDTEFPSRALKRVRQPNHALNLNTTPPNREALHPPMIRFPSLTISTDVDANETMERENSGFSVYNNQNKRK